MKKILSLLLILSSIVVLGQREGNNWYFGKGAGLKFNTDGSVSVVTDGKINALEGSASISDCNGDLLFYTDGVTVWNRYHRVMQNGLGLMGGGSSTHSATIVKEPGSINRYYIFTVGDGGFNGLNYSIVDMSLDGGRGAITSVKNVLLTIVGSSTEKITIVKHANGVDFWIISLDILDSEAYAFLLNSSGINNVPAVSSNVWGDPIGYMKASPDGAKICVGNFGYSMRQDVTLYDFDNITGVLSNPVLLFSNSVWCPYGVEFSSNGDVLYVSLSKGRAATEFLILQFDLSASNISSSAVPIVSNTDKKLGALQIGVNNKIYFAVQDGYVGVINKPNRIGLGCDPDIDAIFMEGKEMTWGLPNFPQFYVNRLFDADGFCLGSPTHFTLNNNITSGIIWDFGDGSSSTVLEPYHQYAQTGVYTVTLSGLTGRCNSSETMKIEIFEIPTIASGVANQQVCGNAGMAYDLSQFNAVILGSQSPTLFGVNYFESLSDLTTGINSLEPCNLPLGTKTIYYKIYNLRSLDCYNYGNFDVTLYQEPNFNMNDEYVLCENSSLHITAPAGFYSYLWSTGAITPSIVVTQPGNYSVTVTNNNGFVCSKTENFLVRNSSVAIITSFVITDWTENDNSFAVMVSGLGEYEYSLDGVNYQDSNFFSGLEPGEHTVFVRDKKGCGVVVGDVFLLVYPRFFTPNGDGFNENWQIKFSEKESNMKISIFDRYGKLILKFTGADVGWDGKLNGKPVASDDYWFVVERENGKEFKGHFTLKR